MNAALYGAPQSGAGLSDVLLGVSVPFAINEAISITPAIMLSSILESDEMLRLKTISRKLMHLRSFQTVNYINDDSYILDIEKSSKSA